MSKKQLLEVYSIFLGLDREKLWLYFGYITLARNYYYHLYNCASGHYSMPSLYFMLKMNEVWWTEEIAACFKPEKESDDENDKSYPYDKYGAEIRGITCQSLLNAIRFVLFAGLRHLKKEIRRLSKELSSN